MRAIGPYFTAVSFFGVSAVDTYTSIYTPLIVFFSYLCILCVEWFGHPISCAADQPVGADLLDKHHLVIEFCRREAAEFLNIRRHLPTVGDYQWLRIALFLGCLLFFVPHIFWVLGRTFSVYPFTSALRCFITLRGHTREETRAILAEKMDGIVKIRSSMRSKRKNPLLLSPISILYVIFKTIVILCTLLLNVFIFGTLIKMPTSEEAGLFSRSFWTNHHEAHGLFAQLAVCYFPYRFTINIPETRYTCVLTLNAVTEKLYIVLFLWLTTMIVLNTISTLYWVTYLASARRRKHQMTEWFKLGQPNICLLSNQRRVDRFIRHLGSDTWLLLSVSGQRGGLFIAAQAISALWTSFLRLDEQSALKPVRKSTTSIWSSGYDGPVPELPIVTGTLDDAETTSLNSDVNQHISSLP
ncbi:unnamed protein product, partial [Mesorhabditis spiculigera]